MQEDVTERRRDEERIRKLINFDALTGLPNRTMFASRFSQALALTQRSGHQLALLYLDLDHFKNVNDSLGHQVGDGLLIEIAHRLQSVVRDEDTVSRQGGDEFVIVLPLTDAQQAAHVADELQAQVRRICKLEHHELVVTSSIGIAMYPEDGGDFETLAQRADAAMFRAKESGRDTYRFFSADMQARSLRVLQIENALRSALVLGQLTLHYQPQIRLKDRRLVGWRPCCAGRTPSWVPSARPNSSRWQRAAARFWASANGCCALRWPRPGSGVMQAIPSWWWR